MDIISDISRYDYEMKPGLFFRASERYLETNLQEFLSYGINTVIDLRTKDEVCLFDYAKVLPSNISYHNIPIEVDRGKTLYSGTPMESVYRFFASENLKVMLEIAETINCVKKPVLMHCRYGIDRTGVVCALLQFLIGSSKENIFKEYMLPQTNVVDKHLHIFLDELAGRCDLAKTLNAEICLSLKRTFLKNTDVK